MELTEEGTRERSGARERRRAKGSRQRDASWGARSGAGEDGGGEARTKSEVGGGDRGEIQAEDGDKGGVRRSPLPLSLRFDHKEECWC